jgi:hypothetical protein
MDGRWEITCPKTPAQDRLEHRLGNMIRRTLAGGGETVGEVVFRAELSAKRLAERS